MSEGVSYYRLDHFTSLVLHDKPLASIRRDLNAMGIKRGDDFKEPEDHIACLCEIMSGMITGEYGKYFSVPEQRSFFKKHIQPWAEHFLQI